MFEGKHKCHKSNYEATEADKLMIFEQYIQEGVAEDDVGEILNEKIPKAEIVGYKINVPVQILRDWDIGLFLFVPFN